MCACEHGLALRMGLQLARLRKQHGIVRDVWDLHLVPMSPPTGQSQLLSGVASTSAIDGQRMSIRAFGLTLPRDVTTVPLYFKHREHEVVGKIHQLAYDANGILTIRCTVDHPEARRCNAFSVGAAVRGYEIVNADRPDFHARITQAVLQEVSLTDVPSNPDCRVTSRHDVSAQVLFLDHALLAMQLVQRSLAVLQQMQTTGART